jgi:hypothetical protein
VGRRAGRGVADSEWHSLMHPQRSLFGPWKFPVHLAAWKPGIGLQGAPRGALSDIVVPESSRCSRKFAADFPDTGNFSRDGFGRDSAHRHLFESHRQRWLFLCKAPRGAAHSRVVHSLFAQSRGRCARKTRPFSHSKMVYPTSALLGSGRAPADYSPCGLLCVSSTADRAKVRRGLRTVHARVLASSPGRWHAVVLCNSRAQGTSPLAA